MSHKADELVRELNKIKNLREEVSVTEDQARRQESIGLTAISIFMMTGPCKLETVGDRGRYAQHQRTGAVKKDQQTRESTEKEHHLFDPVEDGILKHNVDKEATNLHISC